jgi:hypothetical protein
MVANHTFLLGRLLFRAQVLTPEVVVEALRTLRLRLPHQVVARHCMVSAADKDGPVRDLGIINRQI